MIKKLVIFIVVVLVGGLLLVVIDRGFSGSGIEEAVAPSGDEAFVVVAGVTYAASGFEPNTVTIKAGENVVFMNQSSKPFWPASAVHPTHAAYPGSSITKCGTPDEQTIFDACKPVAPGGEWAFKFNEVGSWKYHDHLNAARTGTVVVQ